VWDKVNAVTGIMFKKGARPGSLSGAWRDRKRKAKGRNNYQEKGKGTHRSEGKEKRLHSRERSAQQAILLDTAQLQVVRTTPRHSTITCNNAVDKTAPKQSPTTSIKLTPREPHYITPGK
jgi:hypothetical protein